MPALLVRQAHSRFQLRRGTGFTTALGAVLICLALALFFIVLAGAPAHPAQSLCPALFAVALGVAGLKVMGAGALLLESEVGSTFVASLNRTVSPNELRGVEVRWRYDTQRDKEVDVWLKLESQRVDVTQGWLPHADPDALGAQLSSALGVPAEVQQDPSPPSTG